MNRAGSAARVRRWSANGPGGIGAGIFCYLRRQSGIASSDAYARRIIGWRVGTSAPRVSIPVYEVVQASGRGRYLAVGRQCRRQLRLRSRGDDQQSVQGRGHPPLRPMALFRGRRIRDARMGRQVRYLPLARAHGEHPARRSRIRRRVANENQPSENPERFTIPRLRKAKKPKTASLLVLGSAQTIIRMPRSMPSRVIGTMRSSKISRIMPMLWVYCQCFCGTGLIQRWSGHWSRARCSQS